MVIQNGLVFVENQKFERTDIRIRNGRIAQIGEIRDLCEGEERMDVAGNYVVPGFVDLHLHGAAGHDFCDRKADSLQKIAAYESACGVTSFCPATMSLPLEVLEEILQGAAQYAQGSDGRVSDRDPAGRGARLLGIHLEGPFLAASKKGAQKEQDLRLPKAADFWRLQRASGNRIRILTLAPELPGGMEFIREMKEAERLSGEKIHLSIGHSEADYETAMAAFEAGADRATHLMNAMPGLHHRTPGIVGAVMDREDVTAEVICDGAHIHPAVLRMLFRALGPDRICLISDSMEATGMPDGAYQLGGQTVWKRDGAARLADGTLAGSVTDLFTCFQKALSFGILPGEALRAVTGNPARSIGREKEVGVIREGACGDVLILDPNWERKAVILGGILQKKNGQLL